jgi:CheY-like chemotaxis protein
MFTDSGESTILHVEDNTLLTQLVKTSFLHFGFRGDMLTANTVTEALRLLAERARLKKPVSLIITDMQLPDGTGLDLIREVKSDPDLRMIPVMVLSQDVSEGIVNDAYALGASSYVTKDSAGKTLLESLQSIYNFWLEAAELPRQVSRDQIQDALERAIALRTRTSELYLRMARAFRRDQREAAFWLDRTMNEGNMANLLAFFRNRVHGRNMQADVLDRLTSMQARVKEALKSAEEQLAGTHVLTPELACRLALELTDALDEEVFAEGFGILFPASSVATTALKARAAAQMKDLASYVRERTTDETLLRKAQSLFDWSQRICES